MGMLVDKDNLGFGYRSWRYAAVVEDMTVTAWMEEPGRSDNYDQDPYMVSNPENVLEFLGKFLPE
jgi:peroxiredoxin